MKAMKQEEPIRDRVLAQLKRGGDASTTQLYERLEVTDQGGRKRVVQALRALVAAGQVGRRARGLYAATEPATPDPSPAMKRLWLAICASKEPFRRGAIAACASLHPDTAKKLLRALRRAGYIEVASRRACGLPDAFRVVPAKRGLKPPSHRWQADGLSSAKVALHRAFEALRRRSAHLDVNCPASVREVETSAEAVMLRAAALRQRLETEGGK